MTQQIQDLYSLGIEPLDVLGFQTEEELLDALIPLMQELDILIEPDAIARTGGKEISDNPDPALHIEGPKWFTTAFGQFKLSNGRIFDIF